MIVSSYGLHWAPGGVAFLVQPLGSQNLISPDLESPFVPHIRPKRMRCPHNIDIGTIAEPPSWLADPLAQLFLPTPRRPGEKAKVIRDNGRLDALLPILSRLCSATEPLTRPLWWKTPNESQAAYCVTNITPLVWTAGLHEHTRHALRHGELGAAFGRRVLLVARDQLPLFDDWDWISTELTTGIASEPLEAIGAGALRESMREGPQH